MLIYSDFTDFYDALQNREDGLIYERVTCKGFSNIKIPDGFSILGVCGRRFLKMHDVKSSTFDQEVMKEWVKKEKRYNKDYSINRKRALARCIEIYPTFHDFSLAPIWDAYDTTVVYNCKLPNNFHTIMSAAHIYQELCMWHNNLAEPRKPIPAISNEDMIQAKGFDLKYSFRKAPSKKR